MTGSAFKTYKSPDGTILHVYLAPGKPSVPHSLDGPAIKYPKGSKKQDEYYIYGIKYTKEKWTELKNDSKVTYMPIDPDLQ